MGVANLLLGGLLSLLLDEVIARSFHFSNQCLQPLRLGYTGGSAGMGTFYDLSYEGADLNGQMLQPGATIIVDFSQAGRPLDWNGDLWAGTQCSDDGSFCMTGGCAAGAPCSIGGPAGPTTRAEMTLTSAFDFYDIAMIEGINVPMEFRPFREQSVDPKPGDAYWCGAPGATTAGALNACSWDFNPLLDVGRFASAPASYAPELLWVRPDMESGTFSMCSEDADCQDGQRCGRRLVEGSIYSEPNVCGLPLGWWSAVSVCPRSEGVGAPSYYLNAENPFQCFDKTGQGDPTTDNADLYGCDTGSPYVESGYTGGATETCCGCPDYPSLFPDDQSIVQDIISSSTCQNSNPYWQQWSSPFVKFLKQGCPTAYTFAYDDPTSSFVCSRMNANGGVNDLDYEVIFCPGDSDALWGGDVPSPPTTPVSSPPVTPTSVPAPSSPGLPTPPPPAASSCIGVGACFVNNQPCDFVPTCATIGGLGCIAESQCKYCGFTIFDDCSSVGSDPSTGAPATPSTPEPAGLSSCIGVGACFENDQPCDFVPTCATIGGLGCIEKTGCMYCGFSNFPPCQSP